MGLHAAMAVFLLSHLCIPDEATGMFSNSKSRFRVMERRSQIGGIPLSNALLIHTRESGSPMAKRRQEQFDDYGHMRFGKRGEGSEDYGHMRFGKRD